MSWNAILGDLAHNFSDGVFIGAAFMVCGSAGGWTVTGASMVHESLHELANFMVLVNGGMSPYQVGTTVVLDRHYPEANTLVTGSAIDQMRCSFRNLLYVVFSVRCIHLFAYFSLFFFFSSLFFILFSSSSMNFILCIFSSAVGVGYFKKTIHEWRRARWYSAPRIRCDEPSPLSVRWMLERAKAVEFDPSWYH